MAVSNLGTLAVYLTAQTGQFNNALRKARMSIASFSGIVKTGIAASVATMGVLAVKGVQAYAVQEDAVNNLNAALSANGDSIERYSQKFQDFASKMQSQTIFGDEATLETMAYGRNLGIVASKLEEATTAAAGLAAKYNIDLNSAMQLIGRASQGQTGTLARYGIILDDTLSKEEKFNQLLKIGVSNFSLAEAKANTFSGKMKQLSNAWGDMLEEVGKSIAEGANFKMMIDSAIKKIQSLTQWLKSIGGEASYMMQEITIYVKSSIDALSTIFKPFGTMAGTMISIVSDLLMKFGKNIATVATWLVDGWGSAFKNIWEITKALVKDIGSAFADLGVNIWKSITMQDTDWNGMLANMGKNLDQAAKDTKLPALELDFEMEKFDGFGKAFDELKSIPDELNKIADARDLAIDKLFVDSMEKLNQKTQDISKKTEESKIKVEPPQMKFAAAVEAGTVDAYRAELSGKNSAEEYSKKTADNTSQMVKEQKSLASALKPLGKLKIA